MWGPPEEEGPATSLTRTLQMEKLEFSIPKGLEFPTNGDGETVEFLATFKRRPGNRLCLVAVDGQPLSDGSEKREPQSHAEMEEGGFLNAMRNAEPDDSY